MSTAQKAFDTALSGIRAQGGMSRRPRLGSKGCFYRGDNGAKCGVGHLIADEHYGPNLEYKTADNTLVKEAVIKSGFGDLSTDFLLDLQGCHDNVVDDDDALRDFEANMARLAINRGLVYTPPAVAA